MSRFRVFILLVNILIMAVCCLIPLSGYAAINCDQATLQAAINSAASGDTITCNAGSWTWASPVKVSGKALTIQGAAAAAPTRGAGKSSTIITAGTWPALSITATATNFVTISGIQFNDASHSSTPIVSVSGTFEDVAFRFTNCTFSNINVIGIWITSVYGLIDHCNMISAGNAQIVRIVGDDTNNGALAWDTPLQFGTNKFVYMEDSVFTGPCDDLHDGYNGSRVVARHNDFHECSPGNHGTDSGNHRSGLYQETYSNAYYNNGSALTKRIGQARGGTAITYDNTIASGSWNDGYTLQYWRMCTNYGSMSWDICDGTNLKMNSGYDQFSTGGTYFACSNDLDKWCTSSSQCTAGGTCNAYVDQSASVCRDMPGRGPKQILMPLYEWNNSSGFGGTGTYDGGFNCTMNTNIRSNRDYYDYVSSGFNGTVGVGRGTLAARPATCATGVAYWATDQNTLYQCSGTNTWTIYYTPYTYPHPLSTGSSTASKPNPPMGLMIN